MQNGRHQVNEENQYQNMWHSVVGHLVVILTSTVLCQEETTNITTTSSDNQNAIVLTSKTFDQIGDHQFIFFSSNIARPNTIYRVIHE